MMKLRPPAIPLINIDPYFSVWSNTEKLYDSMPMHWTESPNSMIGTVIVDEESFVFMGKLSESDRIISQTSFDLTAMSSKYSFANEKIELNVVFTSPLLVNNLYYASRPVAYLSVTYKSLDGNNHKVLVKISVSEEIALNLRGESEVVSKGIHLKNGVSIQMGNKVQNSLSREGDNIRIDWGYFNLGARNKAVSGTEILDGMNAVYVETVLENGEALFTFAYDDIDSLIYFQKPLKAYWCKDGKTIIEAIEEAMGEYEDLYSKCEKFSKELFEKAVEKGSEKYAELLLLSYRQVMAAHKLVADQNGECLYVSKECFSNGCAATVDVTYPSAPMYLLYNTELLKGMLRPVFKYAMSDDWKFDFAPHDLGTYPVLNGQAYGNNELAFQMPVEECGNMIILMAAICKIDGNADFAKPYFELLTLWSHYLLKYGADPEDQICTDDFAGRLAHNCNLSLKAIMGIAGYAMILEKLGRRDESKKFSSRASQLALDWCRNAANEDGSYRLAFDQADTFSLKYNAVWDKVWGMSLFPDEMFQGEILRYKNEMLQYGVPLDNREVYTKSDWLIWVASFAKRQEEFNAIVDTVWQTFHDSESRVPMTDWYSAKTAKKENFQHRSVQGGLFINLLVRKR